ncbi:MAG TPA: FkbM family methyltransferase [Rhizobiales bacterium]|nr:FkbM family methyltransferase [Hyphomicrobiales bacterium]
MMTSHLRHQGIYLGNNRALTQTKWGHKVFVDTTDVSLTPHILLDGYWEMWITKALLSELKPGMTFVDIGSNLGYFSILGADAVGESGKVISFEANPEMHELTYRNLEINGFLDRSECHNKAAFSENTMLEFKLYEKHKGSSSLYALDEAAAHFHDSLTTISVEAVTLDSALAGRKVDVIKMDAEGAEPAILSGARNLLADNPDIAIFMEFSPGFLPSMGESEAVLDMMTGLGFSIRRIDTDSSLVPVDKEELLSDVYRQFDLYLKREA